MGNTLKNLDEILSRFYLINLTEKSKNIPLPENKDITIGRHDDNLIRISDHLGYVSRFHAVIRIRKGKCYFEDLAYNKNDSFWTSFENYTSTTVGWKHFKKGEETPILKDTVIRLGGERVADPKIPGARVCDIKIVVKRDNNSTPKIPDGKATFTSA